MKINAPVIRAPIRTHEGAPAQRLTARLALRRSVMACMLWEGTFYESGEEVAKRIERLVAEVTPEEALHIAVEARVAMKLRHAPLLIVRAMARLPLHKRLVSQALEAVIRRPDELTEFLAIYWKEKRQPLSAQVKKGLAKAFAKFDEYALAKYNRDGAVRLRDVLFLAHSKPSDAPERKWTKTERKLAEGKTTWLSPGETVNLRVVTNTLRTPDTWEVALSAGADKRETFERLMAEKKLGGLALLRNLRNMQEAGVPQETAAAALASMDTSRVLPFRFIAAARAVPGWESIIEAPMLASASRMQRFAGRTIVLVDVSGSMAHVISARSELRRLDAACGVAILARELCEDCAVYSFSDRVVEVPPRRGFALRDAIVNSQPNSGTYLGRAVDHINALPYDRLIVITDEQSADAVGSSKGKGYVINVATNQHGVGYGSWTHIDGWSETVLDYIQALEGEQAEAAMPPTALDGNFI